MSQLPPLNIPTPPKPDGDEPVSVQEPAAPKKSKAGKVLGIVFGGCFGLIALIVITMMILINNSIHGMDHSEPLSAQDKANQPKALAYNALIENQKENLPDFSNWMEAMFTSGIPCESNADKCLIANTGSTDGFSDSAGPSKLRLSDAPRICNEVLAVAKTLGANEDYAPGDSDYTALTDSAAQKCVNAMTLNGRSVGFGWWSPSYFVRGKTNEGTPFAIQLNEYREANPKAADINQPDGEYISFSLTTSSIFDSPKPKDDPQLVINWNTWQAQAGGFLDTLAYVRRFVYKNDKNMNPLSPEVAKIAQKNFDKNFKVSAKFDYFTDSSGSATWFHIKGTGGAEYCVFTGTIYELTKLEDENLGASMLDTGITGIANVGSEIKGPASKH
ncbi:MAG: hypothetical protein RL488_87, partial [Actinomycetota bacterium]